MNVREGLCFLVVGDGRSPSMCLPLRRTRCREMLEFILAMSMNKHKEDTLTRQWRQNAIPHSCNLE